MPTTVSHNQPSNEEWLTVKEFAQRVGMHERSVRDAIRDGRLAYRVERITPSEVVFTYLPARQRQTLDLSAHDPSH